MLIGVKCPKCGTVFQVQDALRGKAMRCPVGSCKHVFVVEDTPPPAPQPPAPAARPNQTSGSIGDLVPLVGAESAEAGSAHVASMIELLPAEPIEAPPSAPAWASAPPPVRRVEGPAPVLQPAAEPTPDWASAPPPVRNKGDSAAPKTEKKAKKDTKAQPAGEPVLTPADEPAPPPRGRLARWIILPFLMLTLLGGAVGGYLIYIRFLKAEELLREKADADYAQTLFDASRDHYARLLKDFPDSEYAEYYTFRKALSDILARIHAQPDDPDPLLDNIEQLVKDHAKSKTPPAGKLLLPDHARAIGDGLIKLMTDFGTKARAQPDLAANSKAFEKAKKAVALIKAIKLPPKTEPPNFVKIDDAARKLAEDMELAGKRKQVLDALKALVKEPSYRSLGLAERMLREEGARFQLEAEITAAIEEIKKAHLAAVSGSYTRVAAPAAGNIPDVEDEPAILIDSHQRGTPATPPPNDGTVLALCRGVLYGMSQTNGQVRWAVRVGIDTTSLPVRVPAGVGSSERILVLSSDTRTLTAVDGRGTTLWRYRLGAPCLGRPAVVGNRAYLGTYSDKGEVHEIELAEGKLVGRFTLGQPLAVGGVHEPRTGRLYFAAEDGCVYVLRLGANPIVESIIYSHHPAGSLRGEPVVIPKEHTGGPRYVVLTVSDGLRSVELKAFEQADDGSPFLPAELTPRPRLEGWTWFPSYHDPEKIVMLTDAGVLGAFGIKQGGLRDRAIVPLLPEGGLRLDMLGEAGGEGGARAAVMQIHGEDLWVLGRGRLQRLRKEWEQDKGPVLTPLWAEAPRIGSPLHRGQAWVNAAGRGHLVAVTRAATHPACLASCVDDERGTVLWQRQLGLVSQGEPVPLPVGAGEPLLLVQDEGGSLFALDPMALAPRAGAQWVPGRVDPIAGPLASNPRVPPAMLTEDGKSWYVVSCPGGGTKLIIRHVTAGKKRTAEVDERVAELPDTLAGRPALMSGRLLLPLADGTLAAVPLAGGAVEAGPDWRSPRLGREVEGLVAGAGDRFVTCDGGRGMSAWEWKVGKPWELVPAGSDPPTLEMPGRVVAAPVRLPGVAVRFAVADDTSGLSLVEMASNGALSIKKRWELGGVATGRPFVREAPAGVRIGVVVGRSRLAWIDPGKAAPLEYATKDGDPIIGEPHAAGGVLVVADQSGRYAGLSLETLTEQGKGHALRGSIAPAASPVPYHAGRLLAPLSDGTLLLLDEAKVRRVAKVLPAPREVED